MFLSFFKVGFLFFVVWTFLLVVVLGPERFDPPSVSRSSEKSKETPVPLRLHLISNLKFFYQRRHRTYLWCGFQTLYLRVVSFST